MASSKRPVSPSEILLRLSEIADQKQEHFVVITLDTAGRVIRSKVVFIGTVTATLVHPREIFACAVADMAVSVIVAHNHPSGDSRPSEADYRATRKLARAGETIDLAVLDHLIFAKRDSSSMRWMGLL